MWDWLCKWFLKWLVKFFILFVCFWGCFGFLCLLKGVIWLCWENNDLIRFVFWNLSFEIERVMLDFWFVLVIKLGEFVYLGGSVCMKFLVCWSYVESFLLVLILVGLMINIVEIVFFVKFIGWVDGLWMVCVVFFLLSCNINLLERIL